MGTSSLFVLFLPAFWLLTTATNTGTSFTVVFLANASPRDTALYNEIIITSRTTANVSLTLPGSFYKSGVVFPNKPLVFRFDGSLRANDGVDTKAVFVNSSAPVAVFGSNWVTGSVDGFMAFPVLSDATEFIIPSHIPSRGRRAGLVVGATQNRTTVEVYVARTWALLTRVVLDQHQTYQYTSETSDLTGYYVKASAPIAVFSGGPCLDITGSGSSYCDHAVEQIPAIVHLNQYHITTPIAGRPSGIGYYYRVIAAYDNTTVEIPSRPNLSVTLQKGMFIEIDNKNNSADAIFCSAPCLVPMYNKADGESLLSAAFMTYAGSPETFSTTTSFVMSNNTLTHTLKHYLSIIATNDAIDRLRLDNVAIENNTWTAVPGTKYSSTAFQMYDGLPRGNHVLSLSEDKGGFFANVYGHSSSQDAYGYPTGTGDIDTTLTTTVAPITSTTAPPSNNSASRPQRRLLLNGTFYTTKGEPISTVCQGNYWEDIADSATVVARKLNSHLLSGAICPGQSETFVLTPDTATGVRNNKGTVDLRFDVLPAGNARFPDAETCSNALSLYIQAHVHWEKPIISPLPGCPDVKFQPLKFDDAGQVWSCDGVNTGSFDRPFLSIRLRGLLEAFGSISFACEEKFKDTISEKSSQMVTLVNSLIKIGSMCENLGTHQLTGNDVGLNTAYNQTVTVLNFKMFSSDDATFSQFDACAEDVSSFLQKQENWERPIIGKISGCPPVFFKPAAFVEEEKEWMCD